MPRRVSVSSQPPQGDRKCCFCGLKDDKEFEYGKFHEYDGIVTHYYCLLFSSNMQQKGLDNEGILGFLPGDINKELKRGKRLPCYYCKKSGATLGCCNTKCKKIFHFPCGLKAGSLHQYFGEFRSYCLHHRPKQKIDDRVLQEISQCETRVCYICYDEVKPRDFLGTIWAPCCKKNAWFHRICVQQLAMSAGYFFKCPLCNNKSEFQRAMLDHGIFIPSQDASWELVPNAFQELLYRHNRCDAVKCMCPKGREYTSANAKWELTLCRTCGSQGIHMACGNLKWAEPMWECNECTSILNKSMMIESSNASRFIDATRESPNEKTPLSDDESSTSDSDISVGGYPGIPMETTVTAPLVSQSPSYARRSILPTEEQKDARSEYPTCAKVPLRSVQNGVTQTRPPTETEPCNDELPPLTKRPKIVSCSLIDDDDRRETIEDSDDDDVIVVSGPSRKETSRSINNDRWSRADSRLDRPIVEQTIETGNHLEMQRLAPRDPKVIENASKMASTYAQGRSTSAGIGSSLERVPIEIDLSDSESTSTTSTTVNPEPITNAAPGIPELNIQISNVTSLSPEVFASVPDVVDRSLNDSTPNRAVSCQESDDRPVVQRQPSGHRRVIEARVFDSPLSERPSEGLQIVRLDGTSDSSNSTKPLFYGLAIPGTNTVVPLIIDPPGSRSSQNATPSRDPRSDDAPKQSNGDPSSLAAKLSRLAGPRSRKEAILAAAMKHSTIRSNDDPIIVSLQSSIPAIRNNETLITISEPSPTIRSNDKSKPTASRLSYSVPLETVVNDRILQSKPELKGAQKNDPSDGRAWSNQKTGPVAESAKTSDQRRQIYTPMQQSGPITPSRPASNLPNAHGATRIQQDSSSPCERVNNVARNGYIGSPAVTSANPTWHLDDTPRSHNLSPPSVNGSAIASNAHLRDSVSVINVGELLITPADENPHVSPKNCDGDAGSGCAVQPTSVVATDAKSERTLATADHRNSFAAKNNRDWSTADENSGRKNGVRSDANFTSNKNDPAECSTAIDRGDAPHRTGLINKMINLRDLKFTICGSNTVKMTLYDAYRVDIYVERGGTRKRGSSEARNLPGKRYSDSLVDGTKRSSITREADTPKTTAHNSKARPDSLASFAAKCATNEKELSDQCGSRSQSIDPAIEGSEPLTNDQARSSAVTSGAQDELKENRDPVEPSSTSLPNDAANTIDRRNKCRLRSVGSNIHTMQLLNEQGGRTIAYEVNLGGPRKVANHDQSPRVTSPPRMSYSHWRENSRGVSRTLFLSGDEDAIQRTISPVHRHENARKSRTRSGCVNDVDDGEISDHAESATKRARYTRLEDLRRLQQRETLATSNTLNESHSMPTGFPGDTENRMIPNVRRNERFNFNTATRDRRRTSQTTRVSQDEATSVCCKVSIDLVRIRSILQRKLNLPRKTDPGQSYECTSSSGLDNRTHGNDVFRIRSFHRGVPRKFRSLGDLTIDERSSPRVSIEKTRGWRSAECLNDLTWQSRRDDGLRGLCGLSSSESMRRGYKRNARFFEKHDCVR